MNITTEFKKLWKNEEPDKSLLVPLMIWSSGRENSIEKIQNINKMFVSVDKSILSRNLTLNSGVKHFFKYPKITKENEKTEFFFNDLAKYFSWTKNELRKNMSVIDIEQMKGIIARNFGYDKKEVRKIKNVSC